MRRPLLALAVTFAPACTKGTDTADTAATAALDEACVVSGDRTAGWGELSHSKDAEADYDGVFDLSRVRRIDVVIDPDDYATMQADMETLAGAAFGESGGAGPGGGGGGPEELTQEDMEALTAACEGQSEGEECSAELSSGDISGACTSGPGGELICMPDFGGGGGMGGGDISFFEDDPTYVPATVSSDGVVWCHVGIRYKGNSTLSTAWSQGSEKLPFRLNLDKYEDDYPQIDDQRLYGFSEMTFSNGMSDDSLMHDVLASWILEDRGLPAARNSFVAVYWDVGEGPEYRGLYTMMEDPSDQLMDRVWGDDSGNLYKPEGDCANWTCFEEESFEKKTNEDAADWSDIIAVLEDLNDAGLEGESFRSALEAGFDVDGFLRWLAVNTVMVNWDQYGTMAQNHYVYGVPEDSGRLTWIPWDYSLSLMNVGPTGEALDTTSVFHDEVGDEWPLIRRLMDDEVYRARYEELLAEALVGAMEVETFRAQAETLHALIEPYVIGDDGERAESTMLSSDAAFEGSVDELVEHVESRHEVVTEALAE